MNLLFKQVSSPDDLKILVGKADYYDNIEKYQNLIADETSYQLIAYSPENEFVGFVSSSQKLFPGFLFLGELFVTPKFRHQKVGTELVKKIVSFAKIKNLKGVVTETEFSNLPAQKLYEKCDFNKIDNPNWRDGVTYKLEFA